MVYIAYTRVSSVGKRDSDSERFQTVEQQRDTIAAWAGYHGHALVWLTADGSLADERPAPNDNGGADLDESGGKRLAERHYGALAVRALKEGRAQGLVAAYLSRFSRSVGGALLDIAELDDADAALAICDMRNGMGDRKEELDTRSANGKLQLTILLAFAEYERNRAGEGYTTAKRNAVTRGVWIGHSVPFGYFKDASGRLQPDVDQAKVVSRCVKLALQDGNLSRAAGFFGTATGLDSNVRRVLATNAAVQPDVAPAALRLMLTQSAYIGRQDGKGNVPGADEYPGHAPLISVADQQRIAAFRGATLRKADEFPLSGLAQCAICGGPMTGTTINGTRRLSCSNASNASTQGTPKHKGPTVTVSHDALAMHLIDVLAEHAINRGGYVNVTAADGFAALDKAIESADAELAAYVQHVPAASPGFTEGLEIRQNAAEDARRAKRDAERVAEHQVLVPDSGELDDFDSAELRDLVRGGFTSVIVKPSQRAKGIGWMPIEYRVAATLR